MTNKKWNKILNIPFHKRVSNWFMNYWYRFLTLLEVKRGYITLEGEPLKCTNCKSKELESYGVYHLDGYGSPLEEYSVRCKDCGQHLGTWAYGNWINPYGYIEPPKKAKVKMNNIIHKM